MKLAIGLWVAALALGGVLIACEERPAQGLGEDDPDLALAGTIRCTNGVYSVIDDAGHEPFGIASVQTYPTYVKVTYTSPWTKVAAMQTTPDETYVANDVTVGASVGLGFTNLKFAKGGTTVSPASVCYTGSNVWLTAWNAS